MSDMTITTGLTTMATAPLNNQRPHGTSGSWFEALSDAWGATLDRQAGKLDTLSQQLGNGGQDNPSQITELTAEAMRMSFLSNSSSSSLDSVGKALETMARKS
jgi:hypothetical protein